MEILRGKNASFIDSLALAERLAGYEAVHIDIGTGDGRFVQHIAQVHPRRFAIGIDACRENLRDTSRRVPTNAMFVIANAQTMPMELWGLASLVTINFPWGSLLEGLLTGDTALMAGLTALMRLNAHLDVRLNAGALAEAGWPLEAGADRVHDVLVGSGLNVRTPVALTASDLRAYPTTWAKRLAFGRDPRALHLGATGYRQ